MPGRGGRFKHHEAEWRKNHRILEALLLQARNGIRREDLFKKTGMSRTTIDKHLKAFGDNIKKEGHRLFWKTNYQHLLREKEREVQRQIKMRIIDLRLRQKIASLSGEELKTFSAKEYYEHLKRKHGL